MYHCYFHCNVLTFCLHKRYLISVEDIALQKLQISTRFYNGHISDNRQMFISPSGRGDSIRCDHIIKLLLSPVCGAAALLTVNKSSSREKVQSPNSRWGRVKRKETKFIYFKVSDLKNIWCTTLFKPSIEWQQFNESRLEQLFKTTSAVRYITVPTTSHHSSEEHFNRLLVSKVQPCSSAGGSFHKPQLVD